MSTPLTESGVPPPKIFAFSDRLSIIFAAEAAILSGISILVLIVYKIYHSVVRARRLAAAGHPQLSDACDSSLFLTLMLGESLRATGKVMTLKWAKDGHITAPSAICYTQGMVQLIGTNIIDWSTLAITLHTFSILVLQWNAPVHIAKFLSLGVFAMITLIIGITIGVRGLDIIGPAGLWCWITTNHKAEQLLSDIAIWVIYGHITLGPRDRPRLEGVDSEERHAAKQMAKQLSYYPIVYFISVLPFSITRWMTFEGHKVPIGAITFTTCLFSLSGFFNVLLFFKTRPQLIKGGAIPEPVAPKQDSQQNPPGGLPSLRHEHGVLPQDEHPQDSPNAFSSARHGTINSAHDQETSDGSYFPSTTGHRDDERALRQQASSSSHVFSTHRQVSQSPAPRTPLALDEDDRDQGYLPP